MNESGTPLPGPGPEAGYRLVREASDRYRRTGARVDRFRKQLAAAEREHKEADRALRLAIRAVQPILPEAEDGEADAQAELP
jgi:hypothetical protein